MLIIHCNNFKLIYMKKKIKNIFWSLCSCDISIVHMDFFCLSFIVNNFKMIYMKKRN